MGHMTEHSNILLFSPTFSHTSTFTANKTDNKNTSIIICKASTISPSINIIKPSHSIYNANGREMCDILMI